MCPFLDKVQKQMRLAWLLVTHLGILGTGGKADVAGHSTLQWCFHRLIGRMQQVCT